MDKFISIMMILLVIAYIGAAIFFVFKMNTIKNTLLTASGFVAGGVALVFIAEAVATFLCWAIVIVIILAIIGAIFGG